MSEHLLEVKDLHVSFRTVIGEVTAVRGVDFYVDKGETLGIVGESGCGKSVTVQTIMRLNPEPPAWIKQGSILYQGTNLAKLTDKEMRAYRGKEFSMIFQDAMTSLGQLSSDGMAVFMTQFHVFFFPSLVICLIVFALLLFGNALRDALDPKLRDEDFMAKMYRRVRRSERKAYNQKKEVKA